MALPGEPARDRAAVHDQALEVVQNGFWHIPFTEAATKRPPS